MIVIATTPTTDGHALERLRAVIAQHPGPEHVALRSGEREIVLGPAYRVSGSPECLTALMDALHGDVR